MIRVLRATLLIVFVASVATMVVLRSPGDDTVVKGGRYFVRYKQLRYEISRGQYEDNETSRWRNRTSGVAAVTMFASLFAFVGIESVRFRSRRTRRDPVGRAMRLRNGGLS